ncbi:MAG: (d)CMP kinase [Bacteroidota bacterium]
MSYKKIIITIDGYSSCGKSTFAKQIAEYTGYIYIDSGAMYRAVTLYFIENGLCDNTGKLNNQEINHWLDNIHIHFDPDNNNTILNGRNIEKEIRLNPKVADHVSQISQISNVRRKLVDFQRSIGKNKGIVMDGRDIGTVVFPNAELKIFLTAKAKTRAQRRFDELINKGIETTFEEVLANIQKRDYLDENREESPLTKPHDAIVLDNSHMTPEQQMEWIKPIIRERQNI